MINLKELNLLFHQLTYIWQKPKVFETDVGVKYKYINFNSNHFAKYTIGKPFSLPSYMSFSDFVMPPDLLRNEHTFCGQSILKSPHFHLMKTLAENKQIEHTAYVLKAQNGMLDARLPNNCNVDFLKKRYLQRIENLQIEGFLTVFVIEIPSKKRNTYVIADGKHRLALLACLNYPQLLRIQLLSNKFTEEPFFQKIYSYMLNLNSEHYSINQKMIKAILYESRTKKNCE